MADLSPVKHVVRLSYPVKGADIEQFFLSGRVTRGGGDKICSDMHPDKPFELNEKYQEIHVESVSPNTAKANAQALARRFSGKVLP